MNKNGNNSLSKFILSLCVSIRAIVEDICIKILCSGKLGKI